MATKKETNLIHIKLEYDEALGSKKALLASQINALRISKIMKRYRLLRAKEFAIKQQIGLEIKELKKHLTEILHQLPKTEIPGFLRREKKRETLNAVENVIEEDEYDSNLEKELQEIQRKLAELQE